ncbi:polysaccharide biosynthesis tyrosine autokinase [Porphyrobacter algicida]|uniref:non-specific protein-tyrosine kinase n=1 Tax=Qipengyuania algicida TaxID=1836209 RepID=A0A845AGK6_9SPHN|nr:polysaccharide biosynthesis tyrosine autokinase [Qipengyuania algicida]MXP27955.1 polysaccharide biosynthesis tyrosine autokinase [Qipengyuania algicida]
MNILSSKIGSGMPEAGSDSRNSAESVSPLRDYLRIALRWRWVILGAIVSAVLLSLIITLLMTPKFTATSTIEISRDGDQVTNFQGVQRDVSVADQEFYQTQYGLLRSRSLSERVATELRLVDDPSFFGMFDHDDNGNAFRLTNGRYSAAGRAYRRRMAGEILLRNLSVDPTRLSRLVDIHFTSPSAPFSAKVANAWADNFIKVNLERKVQATSYGRDVLQQQLADYKQKLDDSQRQLVAYASKEQIINLPGTPGENGAAGQERSIVSDDLAALNAALSKATADRIEAEARYRLAGGSGASTEALNNFAINNLRQRRAELAAQYQQMMVQFEPTYPAAVALKSQIDQLDKSISREEARVSQSLESDYQQAKKRERVLQSKVDSLKGSYLDLRRRSIQYNIFQQEVDTNRALYDGLLQRFKEIGVAGGVGVNNISIVDTAQVPDKPSSPRLLLNIAVSLVLGSVLGAALAFGLEQLDETITDPSEVERRLGLPLLGSIPRVEHETPKEALQDRKSDLVEAYLAVQTSLAFTTEHGVPRAIAVTSTRPAEGKSTTALALATTLARGGRKVLLIDGDMRSPSVHQLGGVGHERGLSNFLAGEEDISSLTFEMSDLGIFAMTAGPIPPNAAELLTGSRLSNLLTRLRDTYDHVVIDSPPVMGLADAPLIATRVEGIIYVVESRGIRVNQVKTAISRLEAGNAHIFGGVLTKFDARKVAYGYGYDYGYSYGRSDERAEEA